MMILASLFAEVDPTFSGWQEAAISLLGLRHPELVEGSVPHL